MFFFFFCFKQKRIADISNHNQELLEIVHNLSLSDLNRVLYRCDQEERDEGRGGGAYVVPIVGPFVYCGLQGKFLSSLPYRCKVKPLHANLGKIRPIIMKTRIYFIYI